MKTTPRPVALLRVGVLFTAMAAMTACAADQSFLRALSALAGVRSGSNSTSSYDPSAPQYQAEYYGAQGPAAQWSQQQMANMMWR